MVKRCGDGDPEAWRAFLPPFQEIAALKREDQELYLMKARGLKEREIAEQTRRPPGTIASQIARLMERLRASLRARGCA